MYSRIRDDISDMSVIAGRCLRHAFRSIDTLITVVAMPIMMMLLFVYVFGGSMNTGNVNYSNYVVPGIVLMCILSGTPYTSVRLNMDIKRGIVDRFRSMPIAKSSILAGHVLTSVAFNMFSSLTVILFAFITGFRPKTDFMGWLLALGILLLFTFAMSWLAVVFGLLADSSEGAGVYAYIILVMLFISSAFTPTDSMNKALRVFAEHQPMTPIIEAVRALFLNVPVGNNVLIAILWSIGILIVSYIASMLVYKRKWA
ncbi:ABC transporter permease [Candidatus Clostridium stratigraminis]|uniref:Transport permease protein n=1 Tax=Candidatus Clostridium stratigraminis TaxID=3381661 RepID=A0ABW8T085_9CLOT